MEDSCSFISDPSEQLVGGITSIKVNFSLKVFVHGVCSSNSRGINGCSVHADLIHFNTIIFKVVSGWQEHGRI